MASFSQKILSVVQASIIIGTSVILTAGVVGGGAYALGRGFDYLRGAEPGSSLESVSKFVSKNSDFIGACACAAFANKYERSTDK